MYKKKYFCNLIQQLNLIIMKHLFFASVLLIFGSCGETNTNTTEEITEDSYTPFPYLGQHEVDFGSDDTIYHTVPSFVFTNQDSVIITNDDVKGKVHLAHFFFTSCPAICPATVAQMQRLQEMTSDVEELVILTHTIDPARDTILKIRDYIEEREINTHNWHFLRAEREYTHTLAKEGYMINAMEDEEADGGFLHSEHFVLIDREGHVRGLYKGTDTEEVDQLAKDIKILIENEY
ncbi:MAG: hypothetical protein BM555_06860 [Crocinitomix sp. MedPE-SWsnd]|nr:MAG: hypothetical protein BM555_06860 [Crocinitomix sp. MedPE-SWsnd]